MKERLIAALDFSTKEEAQNFLKKIGDDLRWVKVGMEIYYREGRDFISYLKDKDYKVFLDLKLHDIPTTVQKATQNLLSLEVDMLNFHASGGSMMLRQVASLERERCLFIAVTQLTSTSEEQMQNELCISQSLEETVLRYTDFSLEAGMDGVVCSALEVKKIKEHFPKCLCVCPGIRLPEQETHDQKRLATPANAISWGADFLVVGRALSQSDDPRRTVESIYKQMELEI